MDPQKLSKLDPKLKAVYERVMGTAVPKLQVPTSSQLEPAQPQTFQPLNPISSPQPTVPPSQLTPDPSQASPGTAIPVPTPAPSPELVVPFQAQPVEERKKGNGISVWTASVDP